jgi:enoyl-CoA hydratase/carnithine racemase
MSVDLGCENILATVEDRVLKVLINRPEKKNALTQAMYTAMVQAMQTVDADPQLRALYITGAGNTFTSGNDVLDFAGGGLNMEESPVAKFLMALTEMKKPLVAAVNGLAIGIGTTLLLHCDLAYAGESAVFQMPFVNLGLCPEAGSSYLLPKAMGNMRASELLLLGDKFSARKAYEYGLLCDVFNDDELQAKAWEKTLQLAAQPPGAVRLAKKIIRESEREALRAVMLYEGNEFAARLGSDEAGEAFGAFIERRKPDFSRFE